SFFIRFHPYSSSPTHLYRGPVVPQETMVGLGGLEPPTSSLSGKRSNRLSYRPASARLPPDTSTAPRSGLLPVSRRREHQGYRTRSVAPKRTKWTPPAPSTRPMGCRGFTNCRGRARPPADTGTRCTRRAVRGLGRAR